MSLPNNALSYTLHLNVTVPSSEHFPTMQHPLKEIRQFFIDLATKYPEFVKMEEQIGSKKGMFAVGITIPPISVSVKSGQSNLLGSRDNDKPKRDEVEEKMSSIVHQKPLFTPKKRKIYIQCLTHGSKYHSYCLLHLHNKH